MTRPWHRRLYMLEDGQRVASDKVDAYLHRARMPLGKCTDCPDEIMPGQQYVRPNIFGGEDVLFHKECYGHGPPGVYLAVATRKRFELGMRRTAVIVKFFPALPYHELPYHSLGDEVKKPLTGPMSDEWAEEAAAR